MPDFDVNEGYLQASARHADPSLPAIPDDGISIDGRAAPYGLDVSSDYILEDVLGEDPAEDLWDEGAGPLEQDLVIEDHYPFEPPHKLPEPTPVVRRTRHLATGHRSAAEAGLGRRVGVKLLARRRRLARRACPCGWKVRVLSTPSRHRRRLWTSCHGQPRQTPGSLS